MHLDDVIQAKQEVAILYKALQQLPARVERTVRLRYGIGCDEHTLEEAAQIIGVTRERIRQIVAKGERLMRGKMRSIWPAKYRDAKVREQVYERRIAAEKEAWRERDLFLRKQEYEAEKAQRAIDEIKHAEERKARLAEWERNNVIAMEKARAIKAAMAAAERARWEAGAAKRAVKAAVFAEKRAIYRIAMEQANARFHKARLAYVAMIRNPDAYDQAVYLEFEAAQDAHYKSCCFYDDALDGLNEEQRYG